MRSSRIRRNEFAYTIALAMALGGVACNSSGPEPRYTLPERITVGTISAVRNAGNAIVIEGQTNLPPRTKLGLELLSGSRAIAEDLNVFVSAGKFRSVGLYVKGSLVPPGNLRIHVFTHFNQFWQSSAILSIVGSGGKLLKPSDVIRPEDPQLRDSDNVLEYNVETVIPPIDVAAQKQYEAEKAEVALKEKAIRTVKKAVLVVDGSRSSMNVEDGFRFFTSGPGLYTGNGWSATPTGPDTYDVTLDFIDTVGAAGEEKRLVHTEAIWEVNIVTKKVLYRNGPAKAFSWVPKD